MEAADLTLSGLMKRYADEEQAWVDMESLVWPDGPICPHCGVINHAYFLKPKNGPRLTRAGNVSYRRLWKCADCGKKFSVLKGTVFEDSHIPVSKWMLGIYLLCSNKNGLAAYEMHRELEITQEAAWFMLHRIRYAIASSTPQRPLSGTVEVDETYVGGKQTIEERREQDNKTPVVTLVQRDGELWSQVMKPVTSKNLEEAITQNVQVGSQLMTDNSSIYDEAGMDYLHQTVNHSLEEWVRGNVHINTAEGYFSQLKRSLDGTHHHVSGKHLHRYVAEFDFRYNTRKMKDGERTVAAIRRFRGKRLIYKQVKAKQ